MGKTTLADLIGEEIFTKTGERYAYYLPSDLGAISFNPKYRIHFVDEVHTLKLPELLYPHMDSKKFTFILACNEFGKVKEPMINRCISLIFEDYTTEELEVITRDFFRKDKMELSSDEVSVIIRNSNGIPREIEKLAERIIYAKLRNKKLVIEDYIKTVIGLDEGLNSFHVKYLAFLRNIGIASLDTISLALRLDREIVKDQVEPILIRRSLITITSRGRKLVNDSVI